MAKSELPCRSVGVLIRKRDDPNLFLCLYRKVQPKGLAMPAGHSNKWEEAGVTARRETLEEVGIKIVNMRRHAEIPVMDVECSRGEKTHWWTVFEVLSYEGEPKRMEPEKHEFVKWMTAAEIAAYIRKDDCDPSWSRKLWRVLEVIR